MGTMMRNHVQLMGNLGRDPEVKQLEGGRRMARLSLATNERFTFGNGQVKEDTQWHSVVAWGHLAAEVEEQLRKGSRITLEGRLVHRAYETKEGQKRYVTEVVMTSFQPIPVGEEVPLD